MSSVEVVFEVSCDVAPTCNWSTAAAAATGTYTNYYDGVCITDPLDEVPGPSANDWIAVQLDTSVTEGVCGAEANAGSGFLYSSGQPYFVAKADASFALGDAWKSVRTYMLFSKRGQPLLPGNPQVDDCTTTKALATSAATNASLVPGSWSGCSISFDVAFDNVFLSDRISRTLVIDPAVSTPIQATSSPNGVVTTGLQLQNPGSASPVYSGTFPYALDSDDRTLVITFRDTELDIVSDARFNELDVDFLAVGQTDSAITRAFDFNRSGAIDAADISAAETMIATGMHSGIFGDVNANGAISYADRLAIGNPWGSIITSSNYVIRLDADLDGDNDASDQAQFDALIPLVVCDSIDFNNDGSSFDAQDIDAFISVFGEGPCIPGTATCNDIDFNNDNGFFDPCDIASFLLVFSEGPCTPCGEL